MITMVKRRGRFWFCVADVICVKTWPAAQKELRDLA